MGQHWCDFLYFHFRSRRAFLVRLTAHPSEGVNSKAGLQGTEWVIRGDHNAGSVVDSRFGALGELPGFGTVRNGSKTERQRRLSDAYSFAGFRAKATVRGVFGDPDVRIISVQRRSKKGVRLLRQGVSGLV